ncbi:1-aminocyclopropane-1-carboxylate deaminase/D-cysteine desulfhydrase [Hydrogenovibrio halophilus]|uniref:1-aminocyclopropane-1-carboxylate deaminase/D-cysteine desulfhydrase n=1 Tax=Hydrogenovibrio halophilus TaxID=373391 RepID=UPI000490101C|nr:pyridoxal-phosphate dependent enzyme [Hydrogenovibrio halophilus]
MTRPAQTLFNPPMTPLQPLQHRLFSQKGVRVWVKRDDLNHPAIQGNKWHKLRGVLAQLSHQSHPALLTFGGAYSNHLAATAAAGHFFGFPTIGLVRGDELAQTPETWSHTLTTAQQQGMQLQFLSRSEYRQKSDPAFLQALLAPYRQRYPNLTVLPEGGTTRLALKGFDVPIDQLQTQCPNWTHLYTAVGTGGTLAGLTQHAARHASPHQPKRLIGVNTLKGGDSLRPVIQALCPYPYAASPLAPISWRLHHGAEFRGYGRAHPELKKHQAWLKQHFDIPLDPIYTSRTVTAFLLDLENQRLPVGARVILYHSGGLQGCEPDCKL